MLNAEAGGTANRIGKTKCWGLQVPTSAPNSVGASERVQKHGPPILCYATRQMTVKVSLIQGTLAVFASMQELAAAVMRHLPASQVVGAVCEVRVKTQNRLAVERNWQIGILPLCLGRAFAVQAARFVQAAMCYFSLSATQTAAKRLSSAPLGRLNLVLSLSR